MLVPITEGSGIAEAISSSATPTTFTARDEFAQTAGNLGGKTLPVGGLWATSGVATDFSVTGSGSVTRATGTEASPRFAVAGTSTLTALAASLDVVSHNSIAGILLRYVDASNYAVAYTYYPSGGGTLAFYIRLNVVVAGVTTTYTSVVGSWDISTPITLGVTVDRAGRFSLTNNGVSALTGQDSRLATGGALASGNVGIYDFNTSPFALTRTFDNFWAAAFVSDAAVFASKQLEIRNDRVIRQDSTGSVWVAVSSFEGDYLLVPPAGKEARTSRVIVKGCRNDPTTGSDSAIDDISAQLIYTPRYLVVPE
jgi:hypothetical protein